MTAVIKTNGKFYTEVVENGRIFLKEVADPATLQAVPPSTAEVRVDSKINAAKQEISAELAESLEGLETRLANLQSSDTKKTLETVELHDAGTFEYEAEKMRWLGQSGLVGVRQYTYGGNDAFRRPFDIGYNPMNIHTHSDYLGLQGMAELALSVNGYYLRTRHNDYRDSRPHSSSKTYQATERLPRPSLPSNVTGSVDNQTAVMQDLYARLHNTLQENAGSKLTAAEKAFFRWDMAYAECWWEVLSDGVTDDPGNDTRHANITNDTRKMLRDAQMFNYGGHKNTLENTGYWVAAVKEVTADGKPAFAVLKFRILMMNIATLADYLPSQLMDHVVDYKTMMRYGFTSTAALRKSSRARFKLKETNDGPGLMDTLINKIPGLDNGPASITEVYNQVGRTTELETIYNAFNTGQINNAGKYFRFSYIINNDASGRTLARRGFNDPYLFVAMNTQPKVKAYTIDGRDYRFSYMIPLELVLRHPLEVWNPYQIPERSSFSAVTGAGTPGNPYSGVYQDLHWYLTPSSFFDQRIDSDAADTIANGRYYRTADGSAVATKASGTYIFLPRMLAGNGSELVPGDGIRIRYPIYPVFHEGSYAFAEIEAMKKYMLSTAITDNPFYNGGSF